MSSPSAARHGVRAVDSAVAASASAICAGWLLKEGALAFGGILTGVAIYFALVARAYVLAWQESRRSDT